MQQQTFCAGPVTPFPRLARVRSCVQHLFDSGPLANHDARFTLFLMLHDHCQLSKNLVAETFTKYLVTFRGYHCVATRVLWRFRQKYGRQRCTDIRFRVVFARAEPFKGCQLSVEAWDSDQV